MGRCPSSVVFNSNLSAEEKTQKKRKKTVSCVSLPVWLFYLLWETTWLGFDGAAAHTYTCLSLSILLSLSTS